MGRPKAGLALPGGHTFLSRVISTLTAARLPRILVVVGAHEDAVRRAWPGEDRRVTFVANARWQEGQLTSLLTGLDCLKGPDLEAVLVTLVDVPLVTARTVRALVAEWRRGRAPIVRPVAGGRHGHPVIFDRVTFAALAAADLALGAKPIVRAYANESTSLVVDDPGAFQDIDTPEEYAALLTPKAG
jgi:CTP:molybdopterin cytidylyltransferase MocA